MATESPAMPSGPRNVESAFLWTRGGAAREALHHLDIKGIDADPVLSKAGLSRDQLLSEQGTGVSVTSQYRFLELAAEETKDALLGLHLAAEMDLRSAGVLFYLAASSATVLEALENMARYAATMNEDILVEISRHRDATAVTLRTISGTDELRRQFSEFIGLAVIRVLRRATNRDFSPSSMTFAHARNSGLREVHRILRCPVEFAHATDSWVLPPGIVELPIVSEDSHLLEILTTHADHLLAARHRAPGLQGIVENQLLSLLPGGKAQAVVVAQQIGMSARSFARHLAEEGTTFSEILDRVRRRLALRYLADEGISLQQIAWLLGYSEVGAFSHAFQRWFGTSPGRARHRPSLLASVS